MQNSQQQNNEVENQCLVPVVVTTPVFNGIISGISSVIAVYFFKPVWDKITKTLNTNKNEIR
jgi:hypothetical protein